MRMETNLEALCADVVDVVDRTMQPEYVTLWLQDGASTHRRIHEQDDRPKMAQQAPHTSGQSLP